MSKIKKKKGQTHHPVLLRNIPIDLHEKFIKECHARGYTMTGKIRAWMADFLKGRLQ